MAFQSAIYTDVSREESIDGEDGFNFQSVSAGVTGLERQVIREVMLHRVSSQWPVSRDEREHPPSCGFAAVSGNYYFSRGISTGTTNNGRRGNQLTQAIVTSSLEDLEPYRPAQLYAARNWSLEKAAGKHAEEWFPPLEIDPAFEGEALLAALRGDPWMLETLPAFLSMIAEAMGENPKKVVLVHDDLDTVMRWIATGTLLVSESDAHELEYRAFAADPFRSRGNIIGVHPDLLQVPLTGAHVINILEQTVTEVTVTALPRSISEWIQRLDAFDALEVVELAQHWRAHLGDDLAIAGSEMVTGNRTGLPSREEWTLGIRVIEALATAGLTEDLEMYLDELGDSVSMYQLSGEEDFLQAARAASFTMGAGLHSLAEAVLLPTLTSLSEDSELQWAGSWAKEMRKSEGWAWPPTAEPEQFAVPLTDILLRAPATALPELLKTVGPIGSTLPNAELRPARQRAVEFVLSHPDSAEDGFSGWYGKTSIERGLRRALVAGIEHTSSDTVTSFQSQFVSGTWDFLAQRPEEELDPSSVLFESWLRAASISRTTVPERAAVISALVDTPAKNTWPLALKGAALPSDMEVYLAWIGRVGADSALLQLLFTELTQLLEQDPRATKLRDAQAWVPLAEALAAAEPSSTVLAETRGRLDEFVAAIPTLGDIIKEKTGGIMNAFKSRKAE